MTLPTREIYCSDCDTHLLSVHWIKENASPKYTLTVECPCGDKSFDVEVCGSFGFSDTLEIAITDEVYNDDDTILVKTKRRGL
jgi:hypothetical protein